LLTYFLLDSYIKATDPSNFAKVIEISSHAGKHDDLVRFLRTARKSLREAKINTELAYAYAETDCRHDMEDFLGMTNSADIWSSERNELYKAAQLLFTNIPNWARLATTLIYLGENQAAVEGARDASNTQYVIRYLSCVSLTLVYFRRAGTCCPYREIRVSICECIA
jgi:clathrin heavy chain